MANGRDSIKIIKCKETNRWGVNMRWISSLDIISSEILICHLFILVKCYWFIKYSNWAIYNANTGFTTLSHCLSQASVLMHPYQFCFLERLFCHFPCSPFPACRFKLVKIEATKSLSHSQATSLTRLKTWVFHHV